MPFGKKPNCMWDNALAKPRQSIIKLLWTLALTLVMVTQNAIAVERSQNDRQCYSDPKQAYQAILAKEQRLEYQAQQKVDNVKVNINTATEGELVSLKGIGSSKAQAIILYREMLGPFATVDELTRVKGIGEKTLEKNRRRLQVN